MFVNEQIRNLLNIKIYIDLDSGIRLSRRIKRDILERGYNIDCILDKYEKNVKITHDLIVEPTKQYADIILKGDNINEFIFKMIVTYIKSLE